MAHGATIYKISLNVADMNRRYYQQHDLTVAQHPSENDLRFMVRVLVYALNAHEQLAFTKGLCVDDEPEIWRKLPDEEIALWIDFGQVDEKRIRKACGRSTEVRVYTYNERKGTVWWQQTRRKLARYKNLDVYHLHADGIDTFVSRKMQLQVNIEDNELLVSDETQSQIVRIEHKQD